MAGARGVGVAILLLLGACSPNRPPEPVDAPGQAAHLVERERVTMGSALRLSAWTSDEPNVLLAFEHVFDDFDALDRQLSVWHPESEISRLNAAAGQSPVTLKPEVMELLRIGREVGDWTRGKFDITFGALAGLWKFDHDQDNVIPSRQAIARLLPLVSYEALQLDLQKNTAYLPTPGMRVHLGGIGKGYAVDRAVAMLRSHGIDDFLIQAGGDLYAGGTRGDRPWRAAIHDPRGEQPFAALDVSDVTFSTSGDYERFFMKNGRRYHHILDPDRGEPAVGIRSVTIVATRAVVADALSTGVFVMGPDEGMALIERLPDVEGVIVTDRNEVRVSTGLRGRLELLSAPTDAP